MGKTTPPHPIVPSGANHTRVAGRVFCVLFLISLILAGFGSNLTQATPVMDISIDFRTFVQDESLRQAVVETLRARPAGLLLGSRFAVTSERREGDWALISIASMDGPHSSLEHVGAGDTAGLVLATRAQSPNWQAALFGTFTFTSYLAFAPESFLSREAKSLLQSPRSAVQTVLYKFPWPPGEWEYWNGWHGSPAALDLGTSGAEKRVLASADGIITHICLGTLSANIHVLDADGITLEYFHLDRSQVGPDIAEGRPVLRGQVLGTLRSGGVELRRMRIRCAATYQCSCPLGDPYRQGLCRRWLDDPVS